jgi:chemotaxis regulatin CheY-phosphate phosphatase CheZ
MSFSDSIHGVHTAHARRKSASDMQSRVAMKMPRGFEGLVWLILEGIRLAEDVSFARQDLLELLQCSDARPITRGLLKRLHAAGADVHKDLVKILVDGGV